MSTTNWCVARPTSTEPVQPAPEVLELGVLQIPELRRAQGPAPEADLDLGLEVAALVKGECLEHDHTQRRQPGQARRARVHPRRHPPMGHEQGGAQDVRLVIEVVGQDAR
jgi:hypothetical protein